MPLASVHAVLVLLSSRTLLAHALIDVMVAGIETTGLQMVLVTMAGFTFSMQDLYEKDLPRSSCSPLTISNVRTKGGYIRGTNGNGNDVVPMPRDFDETAWYVDQGGGQHKGFFAMHFEPWYAYVFDFLVLRKNHGKEEQCARDLFYAVWIPDLSMKYTRENAEWALFCPQ